MRALDIISQTSRKPDYTAALYFELHQNPTLDGDLEVKVIARNRHLKLSLIAIILMVQFLI